MSARNLTANTVGPEAEKLPSISRPKSISFCSSVPDLIWATRTRMFGARKRKIKLGKVLLCRNIARFPVRNLHCINFQLFPVSNSSNFSKAAGTINCLNANIRKMSLFAWNSSRCIIYTLVKMSYLIFSMIYKCDISNLLFENEKGLSFQGERWSPVRFK